MTGARIRFAVALAAFLGWLGWLAVAVADKGRHPVLSRAQLAAATHVVVADVAAGPDGLPAPAATVSEVLRGTVPAGTAVDVLNLPSAQVPGAAAAPPAGKYLLFLVGDGKTYRVAGLPRSPGYDPVEPPRPAIYAWDAATEAQLRALGVGQ